MPSVRLVPLRGIITECESSVALDRDVIVVVEADELSEAQMSCIGRRFVRYAFHHVAITRDEIRVMVDHIMPRTIEQRRKLRLRDSHPYGIANALSERTCRRLNPGRVSELRVSGRATFP